MIWIDNIWRKSIERRTTCDVRVGVGSPDRSLRGSLCGPCSQGRLLESSSRPSTSCSFSSSSSSPFPPLHLTLTHLRCWASLLIDCRVLLLLLLLFLLFLFTLLFLLLFYPSLSSSLLLLLLLFFPLLLDDPSKSIAIDFSTEILIPDTGSSNRTCSKNCYLLVRCCSSQNSLMFQHRDILAHFFFLFLILEVQPSFLRQPRIHWLEKFLLTRVKTEKSQ